MKVFVSNELKNKTSFLTANDKIEILNAVNLLSSIDYAQMLKNIQNIHEIDKDNFYEYELKNTKLFFTIEDDSIILLDIASISDNTSNMHISHNLNPKYNHNLNPKYNTSINPKYNTSINPKYNTSINPKWNSLINPQRNSLYKGPILYSKDIIAKGYGVFVNKTVTMYFDLNLNQIFYSIFVNNYFSACYDMNNEWNGYIVKASENINIYFTIENEYNGFIVN